MIQHETVLVLGAGASMPYGYPSGSALRRMLVDQDLYKPLIEFELIREHALKSFCRTFQFSGMKSIDAFLSRRGHECLPGSNATVEEIGKMGIAIALRKNKSLDSLFHSQALPNGNVDIDRADNWYEYLWDRLTQGVSATNLDFFKSNRLTIVTFNYDLSLEHYLFSAMTNSYGISETQTRELLDCIKFIHLYGKLSGDPISARFHYAMHSDHLENLVREDVKLIEVIDERRVEKTESFQAAFHALETAERICFLGFGFDSTNVNRLQLPELLVSRAKSHHSDQRFAPKWPQIAATTIGFEDAERDALVQTLIGPLQGQSAELGHRPGLLWIPQIEKVFGIDGICKSEKLLRRTQMLN